MARFYRTATFTLLALLCFSAAIIGVGSVLSKHKTLMLPANNSQIPWFHSTVPTDSTGKNKVIVSSDGQKSDRVEFDFLVSTEESRPYTSFIFYLAKPESISDLVDFSSYSAIRFHVRCTPKNILVFALYTYVKGVTQLDRPETYRVSLAFLTCDDTGNSVNFPLKSLDSADWWLERYGLKYTDREADLKHVHGFALNNSLQSPRGTLSHFEIQDLALVTENSHFLEASFILALLAWLVATYFLIKIYVSAQLQVANEKVNTNRPLIAYQKLSIKQTSDDLETRLLRYIAEEYANPEINIESIGVLLGTTRSQINKILKSELGLTFTSYINKLRLTEAARLLMQEKNLGIKQIAFGVGFANVTYFNVLFKKEYGCTPKTFRQSGFEPTQDSQTELNSDETE